MLTVLEHLDAVHEDVAESVHDLNHVAQISRVMAKRYTEEVGAWRAYLAILN